MYFSFILLVLFNGVDRRRHFDKTGHKKTNPMVVTN